MVKAEQIGKFLESIAVGASPINYEDVRREFPELPPLTDNWKAHPLCSIFGELDDEDDHALRPLRTAIVVAKKTNRPGQGFFDTIDKIRGTKTDRADHEKVWLSEYNRLVEYYSARLGRSGVPHLHRAFAIKVGPPPVS